MNTLRLAAVSLLAICAAPASAALVVNSSTIGQRVIVQNTGNVIATFETADAELASSLYLQGRDGVIFRNGSSPVGGTVDLGRFTAGTELVFRLDVPFSSYYGPAASYYTGSFLRNPDLMAHAAVSSSGGRSYVGFEDLSLLRTDRDYNDLIFSFTNTAAAAAVPEPATWGLMLAGFGLVGGAARYRNRKTSVAIA